MSWKYLKYYPFHWQILIGCTQKGKYLYCVGRYLKIAKMKILHSAVTENVVFLLSRSILSCAFKSTFAGHWYLWILWIFINYRNEFFYFLKILWITFFHSNCKACSSQVEQLTKLQKITCSSLGGGLGDLSWGTYLNGGDQCACLRIERSTFKPCSGTLCCVLGQDT